MKKFHSLIPLKDRIKSWFWWHFKATEKDKMDVDTFLYGVAISKDGKRIDPNTFMWYDATPWHMKLKLWIKRKLTLS